MEFRILGPLEVASERRTESIASAKERALLAVLLLEANRVVSSDRLIDELWDGNPPESASTSIRVLVSRLRKTLAAHDERELISTRAPGYLLQVGDGELDAVRFDALCARGRTLLAHGDAAGSSRALREALALWRGPALGDVDDLSSVATAKIRLDESRLTALEDRVDADLAAGQHAPLTAELEALTRDHPLRERLWAQRMVALYRAGRQADALRVYQELRRVLGEELGIEPSPEVVRLETAIVRQEASLDWNRAAATTPAAVASGTLPTGVVTLLLTDIEGSTPLWEAKPAAMADALARHDELLRTIVSSHGGTLLRARGEGDSTFSVFARATDAAEAALEAQETIGREQWSGGIALRVRMALHTGETVERDGDYYGTAVNRAARLRSVAQPGAIVVSQSTAEVIIDHLTGVELVELGEQSLRGLSRPERIYELRPATVQSATASQPTPAVVPLPAPIVRTASGIFVSREAEMARLGSIWAEVAAGKSHLVLLAGEAGIGKTRLAAEFARRASDDGAAVMFGRCDEDGGEPYQPFAEAIRAYLSVSPVGAVNAGPHLSRLVPDLAPQLGLAPAPSLGDADAERRALFDAVARVISSTAAQALIMVDDLHWAAGPTLLLLRHLLRSDETGRVMVVATYRDTDVDRSHPLASALADLRRDVELTRIAVSGLDEKGVVAYVEATAGQQLGERERQLATVVHEQTEGNPFFVVEVLRHLVETGAVYRSEGRWHTDITSVAEAGLPEGVRDVITRRLGRLPDSANRALAAASVIGPEFSMDVLHRVITGDSADALLDALELSVRAGLIGENGPGQYAFTHALIRQTLYGELMSTRRARLHRQVGEAIEALPAADAHLEALAHHFAEAALDGQIEKAVDYALATGRRAMDRAAGEEALAHFERAHELLDIDESVDHGRRADVAYALATAKWSMGDRGAARDSIAQAADHALLSDDATRVAHVAILLAGLSDLGFPDTTTERMCQEALTRLPDSELAMRARVLGALARYKAFAAGDALAGEALATEAIEYAREAGDPYAVMSSLNARVLALQGLGRSAEQLTLANELVELAELHANDRGRTEGLVARCQAHLEIGDRDAMADDIRELEAMAEAKRWWLPGAFAATFRSGLANMDGDFAEAERIEHYANELARGSMDVATAVAGSKAARLILIGEIDEAIEFARPFTETNRSLGRTVRSIAPSQSAVAGRLDEATAHLDEFAAHSDSFLAYDPLLPLSLCILADGAARVGHRAASTILDRALHPYRGLIAPVGRGGSAWGAADRFAAMLAAMEERWAEAERLYESALKLETLMRAPVFLAHTRSWYARMLLSRNEPGDHEHAVALLTDALHVAEELGITIVARDARAMLRPPLPSPLAAIASTFFVGRDREFAQLREHWNTTRDGKSRLVLIAGEPGIGKTRLAAEIARRAHEQGAIVLFGRCDEDLGVPYQPFVEALRTLVTSMPASDLARHVAQHGTDLARIVPEVLRAIPDAPPPAHLEPEVERYRMFEAVRALLDEVSNTTPVLMVFDDLHWAAKSTLFLLRHLVRAQPSRVLIVTTYRDTDVDRVHPLSEAMADLRRAGGVERMVLRGLERDAVSAFVAAASGQDLDEREQGLASSLHAGTEGNPFFLQEVMRHLVESGVIYRSDGRWHTAVDNIEEAGVPDGVRDVIGRRLNHLSAATNAMLTVASVVGPAFTLRLLEAIDDLNLDGEALLDAVDEALRAGVITEASGSYAFSHALIRQTLYEELSSPRRARLHRRVGEAIESLAGAEGHIDSLAHHFAEAALDGQVTKAADYALAAGRQAVERLAYDEAIAHLERGLALLDLEPDIDHDRRVNLAYALATALWAAGDRLGARAATDIAVPAIAQLDDPIRLARVAVLRTALASIGVEDGVAAELCQRALRELAGDEHLAVRARVLAAYGRYVAHSLRDGPGGAAVASQAVGLAREAGDRRVLASALNAQLFTLQGLGRPEEQVRIADELVELSTQIGSIRTVCEALVSRSIAHFELARIDDLREDIAALDRLGAELRWWLPSTVATGLRASLAGLEGRFDESENLVAAAVAQSLNDTDVTTAVHSVTLMRLIWQGDLDEALKRVIDASTAAGVFDTIHLLTAFQEAVASNRSEAIDALSPLLDDGAVNMHDDVFRSTHLFMIAEVCGRADFHEPAASLLAALEHDEALLAVVRGGGCPGSVDQARGTCCMLLGRLDEAETRYQAALELENRLGFVVIAARTRLCYARLLLTRRGDGDIELARDLLTESSRLALELGMDLTAREAAELLARM